MSDTYDVEMPDGTIIEGVPVGTTQAQLNARLGKQSAPQAAAPAPVAAPAPAPMKSGYYKAAPGEEVGPVMQFLGGAKHAWDRAAAGLEDLVPGGRVLSEKLGQPDLQQLVKQGSQFVKETGPASTVGQIAGDVAMSAAPAVKLFKAVNAARGVVPAIAAEAGLNAGYGALTADQGRGAEGAAWGAGGTLAGHGLVRALRGFTPTPEARALMDRGVQPSFGQSMGGMANTVEQKLTSVPFVGDAINYARNRAQREFEAAAVKRALGIEPTVGAGGVVQRATREAPRTLDDANNTASGMFNRVVPELNVDYTVWGKVSDAADAGMKNAEMTAQNRRILKNLTDEYFAPEKLARLDGEGLKHLDSQMGYLIRKYQGGSPADKTLADELRNVQMAFRQNLNENLPAGMRGYSLQQTDMHGPVHAGDLDTANRAYARLVPINKAASQRADERITPRALQRAMASQARMDVSRMPPDALVDSAVKVLPNNIPDSGTTGRVLLGGGVAGLAGSLPAYMGAGAGAYVGATRPVQRALVGNTAWQRALAPQNAEMAALIAAVLRGQSNERK